MTRKLCAVVAALLFVAGLAAPPVTAEPGSERKAAQDGGSLTRIARTALPFHTIAQPSALPKTDEPTAPLQVESASTKSDMLDVVATTAVDPTDLQDVLAGLQITHVYRKSLYGFSARVTPEQMQQLQTMPQIESIALDQPVHTTLDHATRWTGATKSRDDFGITGDGDGLPFRYSTADQVIAIIDTGIDPNHLDLKGKVVGWKDFVNEKSVPYDDNGHGTHVSGIAAGSGAANPSMRGVAPGAALVGVKVLSAEGAGTFSGVIAGIEWVVANKDLYNIRVLNMSLGSSTPSDGLDALSRAVNGAVESGIVAVVSAGNSGPDSYTIGAPAAAARALTVCAMRDVGEGGWSLAPFSSRGPTIDGRIKPDICAPGVRIAAPQAGTTNRYVSYSGTSMASPIVAGTAALLLSANPYLSPDEIRHIITTTAQDWGAPGLDSEYGYGRINIYRAVQRVLGLPGVGPGNPIHATGRGAISDGGEVWYKVEVTDVEQPLAATLILTKMADSFYDYDLYLFDAEGNELAASTTISRHESIHYRPVKTGPLYLKVQAYEGSGPYTLDVSWR